MKDKTITVFIITIIAIIIIPILIVSCMSIPFADDYSYASNVREDAEVFGSTMAALFTRVWAEYITYEGGMFKVFMMNLGSLPLLKGGVVGLRIYILCCHIVFFGTLLWFLSTIFNARVIREKRYNIVLALYAIMVFWIVNNKMNYEMYTWALIQSAYVVPVVFMMLGLGLYVKYRNASERNGKYYFYCISSAFFMFVTGGSPLNVVVLGCGLLFIACYYEIIEKGYDKRDWIIIGSALLGAIINILSPGNAGRHGSDWGVELFYKSFIVSLLHVIKKIGALTMETPFLPLCLLVFFILYKGTAYDNEEKISYDHPAAVAGLFLLGAALVSWPYTFGNGITGLVDYEGRVEWVSDITVYALLLVWMVYFVKYIKKRVIRVEVIDGARIRFLCIGILIVFSGVLIVSRGMENYTTVYMLKSIENGSLKKYSEYQEMIIGEIEKGEGDIYIRYNRDEVEKKNPVIAGLRLCDDPNDTGLFWRNCAIARFYEKQNVFIEYYSNN